MGFDHPKPFFSPDGPHGSLLEELPDFPKAKLLAPPGFVGESAAGAFAQVGRRAARGGFITANWSRVGACFFFFFN